MDRDKDGIIMALLAAEIWSPGLRRRGAISLTGEYGGPCYGSTRPPIGAGRRLSVTR